jgi:hypothetical protein
MGTSTMTNKTDKLLSFYPGLKFLDMQSVPSTWNINGLWINDQSTEIVGWSSSLTTLYTQNFTLGVPTLVSLGSVYLFFTRAWTLGKLES